ncbi:Hypothetical protein CINCED_3A011456 [Cinara cedri]|uniref:Ankyrin repeat-containing domain n=1 Tax=Cinara cedri TaxID=506608 RepID=A0A5E4MJS9_9HEMI|nr:Hypothetical protein CINCED_3A011456 [Cinara cedri]
MDCLDFDSEHKITPLHIVTENSLLRLVKTLLEKKRKSLFKDGNVWNSRESANYDNMSQLLKKVEKDGHLTNDDKIVPIACLSAIIGATIIVWRIEKSNILIEAASITLAAPQIQHCY